MTLPALVAAAQVLSAMAWLMVTYHYLPSLLRVGRAAFAPPSSSLPWDGAGCWAALMGIVQTSFTMRWLALGSADVAVMSRESLIVWIVLYVMNASCAIGILHTWRDQGTDADNLALAGKRATDAVAAWVFLAVCCIGAASWSL